MPPYVWTSELCVGIPVIDKQHENLVGILNKLHASICSAPVKGEMADILMDLESYAHEHFAHEEYYIRQLHACDEDGHELRHKEFASYIADAKLALVERDSVESTQLFYFLASWLMRHIRDEDRVLSRFRHLLHD